MTKEEIQYNINLKAHILNLLKQRVASFEELIAMSEGAYPSIVKTTLEELITEGNGNRLQTEFFENTPINRGRNGKKSDAIESDNSVDPHPLDYDWRFSTVGQNTLIAEILTHLNPKDKIALFGTTTLVAPFTGMGIDVTLFNKSQVLVDELKTKGICEKLVVHDLYDSLDSYQGHFDFVVADPPWYEEFYRAFILRSAQVLKMDGLLFLSMFPWLTRPEAIAERASVVKFAIDAGFDVFKITPSTLKYQTPKFERISLEHDGIDLKSDWRSGDLYVLRRVRESTIDLNRKFIHNEDKWEDFLLENGKRIKLRSKNEVSHNEFSYKHLDTGRILKTVSRRSSLRKNIDLWTSHNEVYSVTGAKLLREALILLQNGRDSDSTVAELKKVKGETLVGWEQLNQLLVEITTDLKG